MITPIKEDEHLHQKALIDWWDLSYIKYKLPIIALFAIPNGGKRDLGTAKKLKAEGVRSGVCDLQLLVSNKYYKGLFIEMKYGKNKATKSQNEFMIFALAQGYYCITCYKWTDAKEFIEDYLADR